MKKRMVVVCGLALAGACSVLAQPVVDGNALYDSLYTQVVVQDTATGFGNSNLGRYDTANGSELDNAWAVVYGGNLYLVLAGNLETNGNKLEIFFDTRAGGQGQLRGDNPDVDFNGLNRMGDDGSGNGLKFQTGFEADFYVTVTAPNAPPVQVYVTYAELRIDPNNPGVGYYLGQGFPKCDTLGGALTGGDPNAPVWAASVKATVDNSNIDGVEGGGGLTSFDPSDVTTGVELCIPLAALGNPTGPIKIAAFVNGQGHDYMSNQALGGYFGLAPNPDGNGNPGEPRTLDLSISLHQPFAVTNPPAAAVGACCVSGECFIMTSSACAGAVGTYHGDNSSCAGNAPCGVAAQGGCCVDGVCTVQTQTFCNSLGGTYQGDGTACSECCAQPGACCDGQTCSEVLEVNCTGDFLGEFTTCGALPEENPCLTGACCFGVTCEIRRQEECATLGGVYLGDGTSCAGNPCNSGACCVEPDDVCFAVRQTDCTAIGGTYLGDLTTCPGTCGGPTDLFAMDGQKDAGYGSATCIQMIQTQFGDTTTATIATANGSELDGLYAKVRSGRLQILLAGNLQTNFNKLELFFDSRPGGQNVLANAPLANVQRMDGMTFDAGFTADFWVAVTTGGATALYLDGAELFVDANNPGSSYYIGNGRSADQTSGGLLFPGTNPNNILCTYDDSNLLGVTGGTAAYPTGPNDPLPADVTTGVELSIPLTAIGVPPAATSLKLCAFVNGTAHDFASNQWLGAMPAGTANLGGTFTGIDLTTYAGDQFCTIDLTAGPVVCPGDTNCNGQVDFADINPFVLALLNSVYCDGTGDNADVSNNGSVGFEDINPFVALLTQNPLPIDCP